MSEQRPFTPHADSIQTAWVLMCQQSRVSTQPPVEELEAEFDRFITQVRTDAYNWGRYDERMAHAWAPPEAEGVPAFVHRLAGAPDES